jgi:hypothetical protein
MHKFNLKSLWLVGIMLIVTGGLASANLITNPGFETGDFTGWTTTSGGSGSLFGVSGNPHTGTYAAFFGAFGSNLDAISQTFATTAGVFYDLSFWLANDTGGSLDNEFKVTFGGVPVLDLNNAPDFGYTLYSFSALATGSSLTVEFAARNGPGYFYLDDVSVESRFANGIPDTGSSAMLLGASLVGLILLQRRFAVSVI